MKFQVPPRFVAGFLAAVIISGVAGLLLYHVAMQFRESRQTVGNSRDVMEALRGLSTALEDMESETRLYVMTGDPAYLTSINVALTDEATNLQQLHTLVTGNPAQEARLAQLQTELDAGIRTLHHLTDLRREQGLEAVLMDINPEENNRQLEAIRTSISAMRARESQLLEQHRKEYDVSVQRTSEIYAVGIALQCALFLLVGYMFLRDANYRALATHQLASAHARLGAILSTTGDGIYQLDRAGRVVYLNPAGEQLLGYVLDEIRGQLMHKLIHSRTPDGRFLPSENCPFLGAMDKGEPCSGEDWYQRKDGSFLTIQCTSVPLRTEGKITGAVFTFHDVTEQKRAEVALRDSEAKLRSALEREKNVARIDFLTGVLNRRGFYEVAGIEAQRSRRYKRPLSLVYVDLDNFKSVNDSLGHESGDELLVQVAGTLQRAVRGTDLVGRLGGDEFAVLLPETDQDKGMIVVEKVCLQLRDAMREKQWSVTFSVGVTSFRSAPESVDVMVREADRVMYSVKLKGKNSVAAHAVG